MSLKVLVEGLRMAAAAAGVEWVVVVRSDRILRWSRKSFSGVVETALMLAQKV